MKGVAIAEHDEETLKEGAPLQMDSAMRMQCGGTAARNAGVQRGRVLYATPRAAQRSALTRRFLRVT
ncbi:hypothetical protein C0Z16_29500 [Paraburkholderia rhynchosiae]|uniref:Uncharacterized protein n=1 Tax=Paraburkholderia rhynchosiae TaxID=487049 RepID=A0ABX4UWL7_9BURK|nr:hypothetical protein C0Z16_29500 [Paraburkholderia rhynchosiae]